MKKTLLAFGSISAVVILGVFIVLQPKVAKADADITSGLAGWWKMDEGSGVTTIDSSGNGNTGMFVNNPSYITGKIGPYALQFNGSNYIDVGSDASLKSVSAITVSAWMKIDSLNGNTRAISDWHQNAYADRWVMYEVNSTTMAWYLCNAGESQIDEIDFTPPLNTWFHVVGVYNGSVATLYVNGVAVGTSANMNTAMNASAGNSVRIGQQAEAGPGFDGSIDDIRIYNRALSASDVAQLYAYTGSSGSSNNGGGSSGNANGSPLSGWAWSSTIGWLSFNSADSGAGGGPYSVSLSTSSPCSTTAACLSGYAWSSNIGWVQFGNLSGFPTNGTTQANANVNLNTGKVDGWARALAGVGRTDGWDGWVELQGTDHLSPDTNGNGGVTYLTSGSNVGAFVGYAWGGTNVGWLQFNIPGTDHGVVLHCPDGSNPPCPDNASVLTLTVSYGASVAQGNGSSIDVPAGNPATLNWNMKNVTGCGYAGSDSEWSNNVSSISHPITSGDTTGNTSGNGVFESMVLGEHDINASCQPSPYIANVTLTQSLIINVVQNTQQKFNCVQPSHALQCTAVPPNSFTPLEGYNGNTTNLHADSSSCPTETKSGTTYYCQYYCDTDHGYSLKNGSCSRSSIQEL